MRPLFLELADSSPVTSPTSPSPEEYETRIKLLHIDMDLFKLGPDVPISSVENVAADISAFQHVRDVALLVRARCFLLSGSM